jgi:hypothetical protein
MTKIAGSGSAPRSGSGSISQRHGSADPDPDLTQNVLDPQHCWKVKEELAGLYLTQESLKSALVGGNVLHR